MKKKIKRVICWAVVILAAAHFFDINLREVLSTVQTAVIDNVDTILPGAKGQFETMDSRISGAIVKNGAANAIRAKTQKAAKDASSFVKHKWLMAKKIALKRGVNIDNIIAQVLKRFKFKYYKNKYFGGKVRAAGSANGAAQNPAASTYSFDYKKMSVEQISSMRQNFINCGLGLQGTPYIWGGENPSRGLDCSSFVQYSAKKGANVSLPRTAREQYESSVKIPFSECEPGDLLFFRSYGRISHVGIYLGRYQGEGPWNGKDIFINAASEGPRTGVTISSLDEPYWARHYNSSGRFIPSSKEIVESAEVSGAE